MRITTVSDIYRKDWIVFDGTKYHSADRLSAILKWATRTSGALIQDGAVVPGSAESAEIVMVSFASTDSEIFFRHVAFFLLGVCVHEVCFLPAFELYLDVGCHPSVYPPSRPKKYSPGSNPNKSSSDSYPTKSSLHLKRPKASREPGTTLSKQPK